MNVEKYAPIKGPKNTQRKNEIQGNTSATHISSGGGESVSVLRYKRKQRLREENESNGPRYNDINEWNQPEDD